MTDRKKEDENKDPKAVQPNEVPDTRPGINMPENTKEAGYGSEPQDGEKNAG